jgi:hypothetical protein
MFTRTTCGADRDSTLCWERDAALSWELDAIFQGDRVMVAWSLPAGLVADNAELMRHVEVIIGMGETFCIAESDQPVTASLTDSLAAFLTVLRATDSVESVRLHAPNLFGP